MAKSISFPPPLTLPPSSTSRSLPFSFDTKYSFGKTHRDRTRTRAIREWQEYKEAVKKKDLARALRFLKEDPMELEIPPTDSTRPINGDFGLMGLQRNWEVLDTCLNADDLRLVGSAYSFLKDRGFLPNFGKYRNIVLQGPREVTPSVIKSSTGLEVSKLSPKKWGVSGSSSLLLAGLLGGVSILLSQGIDTRPNLAAFLGLTVLDAVFLGGTCLAQTSCYWPPYKRRILVHEAGHLLVAYLMGCPIRGVILDPIIAMQMGIQGQAGTQFWDEKLQNELAEGRVSGTTVDRYCMVLFAGIAAEALVYGEAEGGENDENLFRSINVLLDPPLSVAQMSNQARWSVLQSYNLLKWYTHAHMSAVKALENGGSLSVVIGELKNPCWPANKTNVFLLSYLLDGENWRRARKDQYVDIPGKIYLENAQSFVLGSHINRGSGCFLRLPWKIIRGEERVHCRIFGETCYSHFDIFFGLFNPSDTCRSVYIFL